MLRSLFLLALVNAAGAATTVLSLAPRPNSGASPEPLPDATLIARIDRACQDRFGISTAPQSGERPVSGTPHHRELDRFRPAGDAETAASTAQRAGWDVVMYVSGRNAAILGQQLRPGGKPLDSTRPGQAIRARALESARDRVISRPVRLTPEHPSVPAPTARELFSGVVAATRLVDSQGEASFRSGRWFVAARPIRAGKAECLSCHHQTLTGKPARVGDPLGLVLYAFNRRSR